MDPFVVFPQKGIPQIPLFFEHVDSSQKEQCLIFDTEKGHGIPGGGSLTLGVDEFPLVGEGVEGVELVKVFGVVRTPEQVHLLLHDGESVGISGTGS